MLWSTTRASSPARALAPVARRPSNACGEVTHERGGGRYRAGRCRRRPRAPDGRSISCRTAWVALDMSGAPKRLLRESAGPRTKENVSASAKRGAISDVATVAKRPKKRPGSRRDRRSDAPASDAGSIRNHRSSNTGLIARQSIGGHTRSICDMKQPRSTAGLKSSSLDVRRGKKRLRLICGNKKARVRPRFSSNHFGAVTRRPPWRGPASRRCGPIAAQIAQVVELGAAHLCRDAHLIDDHRRHHRNTRSTPSP